MALAFTKSRKKKSSHLKKAAREELPKLGCQDHCRHSGAGRQYLQGCVYKFYTSKELLFFELLEDLHRVYTIAAGVLVENAAAPPVERTAKAVLAACRIMGESSCWPLRRWRQRIFCAASPTRFWRSITTVTRCISALFWRRPG